MKRTTRPALAALLLAALPLAASLAQAQAPTPASAPASAPAQETVRPEFGKPLLAAQDLLKAGKFQDAMAKVHEAEAIDKRTPYEEFILDRIRGSAAAGAGDEATAQKSFEALLAGTRLAPPERLTILEALASSAYRAKDYPKTLSVLKRYFAEGGTDPQMTKLRTSALYLSADWAGVVQDLGPQVQAADRAGTPIDETTLRMLASAQSKAGDDAGYTATLEKLVVRFPKKEIWADLISRVINKPGFSDRLMLDVYRLKVATGTLEDPAQYINMAQLALERGLPAEAKGVLEAGYAAGKLGTGPDAATQKRLRDQATKQAAEDEKSLGAAGAESAVRNAEGMENTGSALVASGRTDKGIALLEQAVAKGGLKRPDEARLRLGEAYFNAGNKAKALEAFKAVTGADGSADVARLWSLQAGLL